MLFGPPFETPLPPEPSLWQPLQQNNTNAQYMQNNTGMVASLGAAFTTVGSSANTVLQWVMPAKMMQVGQVLRIKGWGVNSTTNTVTLTFNFGATTQTAALTLATGAGWYFEIMVVSTGAATQQVLVTSVIGTSTVAINAPTQPASTVNTNTGATTINVQLTAATGTSTMNGCTFELLN